MTHHRLLSGLLLGACPFLPAAAQDKPAPAGPVAKPVWRQSTEVEKAGLRHWYSLLQSKTFRDREAGDEGFNRCSTHLTKELQAWGWQAPKGAPGCRQEFKLAYITLGQGQRLIVGGKAMRLFDHFVPRPSSPNGQAKGTVVPVGLGMKIPELQIDCLAGKDLKGKIALIDRSQMRKFYDRYRKLPKATRDKIRKRLWQSSGYLKDLAAAGAVGVISFRPPTPGRSGRSGTYRTRDVQGRLTFSGGIRTTPRPTGPIPSIYVDHRLGAKLAEQKVSFRVDLVHDTRQTANVVAIRPGRKPGAKAILLGANLDNRITLAREGTNRTYTWTGDNASGCAVLLETARVLGRRAAELDHTLLVALWSGRMKQLAGSRHYVKQPLLPLARTGLVVNLDRPGWRVDPEDKGLNLSYPLAHRYLKSTLEKAAGSLLTQATVKGQTILYGGDAWPFIDNRIPSVILHRRRPPRSLSGSAPRPTASGPPDLDLLARHAQVALALCLKPTFPPPQKPQKSAPKRAK